MLLSEIESLWAEDAKIDETRLDHESLKTSQLHSKYYKIFSEERGRLWSMQAEFKQLKLEKQVFLMEGPTEEQHKAGWVLPARGKVIRQDVPMYLDADPQIIEAGRKLEYQNEKINLLESIIDSLNRRSYSIKNAIAFMQWTQGG